MTLLATDMYAYHRRFDGQIDDYRPALREWVEVGERMSGTGDAYAATAARRRSMTAAWAAWFDEHDLTAVIEPTIPAVAPIRGPGYDHFGTDVDMISLTHFWNWTGFPVVGTPLRRRSLAAACRSASPSSAPAATDWQLLDLGTELQDDLGTPTWPTLAGPT